MVTRLAIIFAPPGRRKQTRYFLEKNLPNAKFHDITTQMRNNANLKSTRELATRPRNFLRKLWNDTVQRELANIKTDDQYTDKLNVMIDHSLFFNGNTREFFPLFDPSFIKKNLSSNMLVSHVALLIDDIFDSFHDLSKEGELFSQRATKTFLKIYAKSLGATYPDLNKNPQADANWIAHCIRTLLNWRAKEMIMVQSISDQLDAKFLLWGIKQDLDVLCKWMNNQQQIFYISHPISEPRSDVKTSSDWPPLVDFINSAQTALKNEGLLTIMPTAIDEYRIEKNNHGYTGKLKLRWPIPPQVKSSLCETPQSLIDDNVDRIDVIHPTHIELGTNIKREKLADVAQIQEFLNGVYSSMDMLIEYEIGNRDHLLVWSTGGIIVIEPFKIEKGDISGGVEMELLYLQNVNESIKEANPAATLNELRKLYAVFSKNSIEKIVSADAYGEKVILRLRRIVQDRYKLRDKIADSVINEHGQIMDDPTSLGDTTLDLVADDLQKNIDSFRNQSIIEQFLSSILTIDPQNKSFVSILILDNLNSMFDTQNIDKIKEFLINSKKLDWETDLITIAKSAVFSI